MTINYNQSGGTTPGEEELAAYLDGEMDAESRERLESQLATDAKLRGRLQALERTWEMLDELDAAPVGEPFTHSTLEMVALAAGEDADRENINAPRRKRRWRFMAFALLAASAAAGFGAVVVLAPDPNARLLGELPLLERFNRYRYADSAAFLASLRDRGLFAEANENTASASGPIAAESSIEQRRQYLLALAPEEKERLRLNAERYEKLPDAERRRVEELHEELRRDPDAERLTSIMDRYYDWLKTLPAYSRAELAEMEAGNRIEWIAKRLQQEELRKIERLLSGEDREKLWKWTAEYVERHENSFTDSLPESQRVRLKQFSPQMRRNFIFGQMMQNWTAAEPTKPSPMMGDDELAQLRNQVSGEARKLLDELPPDQQWKTAALWLTRRPGGIRGRHGEPTQADDERLAEFYEKGLNSQQRDYLLGLPPDEMQRELYRLFLTRERPSHGPFRRNGGGGNPRDNRGSF